METRDVFVMAMKTLIEGMKQDLPSPELAMEYLQAQGPEWMVDNFVSPTSPDYWFTQWVRANRAEAIQITASLIGAC